MEDDILIQFFKETCLTQSFEGHLLHRQRSKKSIQKLEGYRRRLGAVTRHLLEVAIPASMRNRRVFRAKYTEELQMTSLEDCLVSAANKVLDMTNGHKALGAAQQAAQAYLTTLARLQTVVCIMFDEAMSSGPVTQATHPPRDYKIPKTFEHTNIPALFELTSLPGPSITDGGRSIVSTRLRRRSARAQLLATSLSSSRDSSDNSLSPSSRDTRGGRPSAGRWSSSTATASKPTDVVGPVSCSATDSLDLSSLNINPPEDFLQLLFELDTKMAEFELTLVTIVSRRLRSVSEATDLLDVSVLFSETLMWAIAVGLVSKASLADRDPTLVVSLPRMAILVGCRLLVDCPIGPTRLGHGAHLPFMLADSARDLAYLARQLAVLRTDQLWRLACWLGPRGLPDSVAQLVSAVHQRRRIDSTTAGGQSHINLMGLHTLYKCIASISGSVSTNYPTEFRYIIQVAIEINDTSDEDEALREAEDSASFAELSSESLGQQETCGDTQDADDDDATELELPQLSEGFSPSDVFDWSKALFSVKQAPLSSLISDSKVTEKPELPDPVGGIERPSLQKRVKLAVDEVEQHEVGIDVVDWLDSRLSTSGLEMEPPATAASQSQPVRGEQLLWNLVLPAPLDGTPEEARENPQQPPSDFIFAPWQPDRPTIPFEMQSHLRQRDGDNDSVSSSSSDEKEWTDGRQWSTGPRTGRDCARCKIHFSIIVRRHHCRRCGHIFCWSCCHTWRQVEGLGNGKSVRICADCANFLLGAD